MNISNAIRRGNKKSVGCCRRISDLLELLEVDRLDVNMLDEQVSKAFKNVLLLFSVVCSNSNVVSDYEQYSTEPNNNLFQKIFKIALQIDPT